MATPRAGRCIAWAFVVGLTVTGCATNKSAGEDATVGGTPAVTQSRSTPTAGESSGGATTVAEEQTATPPVGESTGTTTAAEDAMPSAGESSDTAATTEDYSAPPTEAPTTRHDGGSPGQPESIDLGGPRLGGSFSGAGHWVSDGDPPRSISVTPFGGDTPVLMTAFVSPVPWLAPPGVPDVEVLKVSVTPGQLFGVPDSDTCKRLQAEPSDCELGPTFDYGQSIKDRSYSADLVFTLRATCPESVSRGCTDENGASIPPGQEVTWTSSIRLTTTGCDQQCLDALRGGHPGDGGVAGSPDQPTPPPADQPAPPADQPTVAGPETVPGGG